MTHFVKGRWLKEKHQIKCDMCGYAWATTSTMAYVTCSNCKHPIRNPHYVPPTLNR